MKMMLVLGWFLIGFGLLATVVLFGYGLITGKTNASKTTPLGSPPTQICSGVGYTQPNTNCQNVLNMPSH